MTKCSQNPGLVNQSSATPRVQLNWTGPIVGPATTENLVVKFDGEICGGVLVENASDDFP